MVQALIEALTNPTILLTVQPKAPFRTNHIEFNNNNQKIGCVSVLPYRFIQIQEQF